MKRLIKTKEDFLELFTRLAPNTNNEDFNGVPCFAPKGVIEKLKASDNFASDIMAYCSLPNNHTYKSYYYAGFIEFTEFLGIWNYGFRSLEAIDRIMSADKKKFFAQAVFQSGMFADFCDIAINELDEHSENYYREHGEIQTCFSFQEIPWLYEEIQCLLQNCSQTTAGYLMESFLKTQKKMKVYFSTSKGRKYTKKFVFACIMHNVKDCCPKYMIKNSIIPKVRDDGFTIETYDYIRKYINRFQDYYVFPAKAEKIEYAESELNFKWYKDGYRFLLPKDSETAIKLNEEVYSPKDKLSSWEVLTKIITEVYVMKGKEHKFLIELIQKEDDNFYTLDSITLPAPWYEQKISFKEYELVKEWCKEKKITIDYYKSGLDDLFETETRREYRLVIEGGNHD